ncbi:chitinase-like protein Idgf3 [Calliphora vicina]|uniref:chitinase-like protein Idgf3 n=1 Tax=Calliphora vicina TaxID=7373 RepID=UPI00325C31D1
MKFLLIIYLILQFGQLTLAVQHNIICYYDASSEDRQGFAHFSLADLDKALEFCTHVIYGYAGINTLSLQMSSLNAARDIERRHFSEVTALKEKYPHIKFLLSVGGDKDIDLDLNNKYIELLEAGAETQKSFIESALYLLRSYKFDGLDLAFQFPRNNNNVKGIINAPWKSLRKLFANRLNETDNKEEDHRTQFSVLVQNLKKAFKPHDLMLSLTVLPNVNASQYFNASALISNLDFINLQTFDFTTPELSPSEATYTAPLYSLPVQGNRNVQHSVDYQVNYWLSQRISHNKINVGRAWKITTASRTDGYPKILAANGPAPAGYITKLPGIFTWTEICPMLPNALNVNKTGPQAPLLSVLDPHKDFVTYAFRAADANGEYGMWVSYDDPRIAAVKAAYVKRRHLGGIALYDVSLDDFHGLCNGDTFPMLRYIKYTFL